MVKADLDSTLKMSSTPHMKRETNSARWKLRKEQVSETSSYTDFDFCRATLKFYSKQSSEGYKLSFS